MLGFTTQSGNSSIGAARLQQVVTRTLNHQDTPLTTWESFRDWIAYIFNGCSGNQISFNDDVISSFSNIVSAQVGLDELSANPKDKNVGYRNADLKCREFLKKAYDAALSLQFMAARDNCEYVIELHPGYVDEYSKRQVENLVQDYDSAVRLNGDINVTVRRRHDNRIMFSVSRFNAKDSGADYQITTFPDPRHNMLQQNIRFSTNGRDIEGRRDFNL